VCGIPPGTWAHVEVRFKSGPDSPKTFSITVRPAGGEEKTIQDLPFRSREFTTCTWLGFSSLDKKKTAYYLDNMKLKME
jgi:hypothetical protein